MIRHSWTSQHRDDLLTRVTAITAGTAVVSAVGAVGLAGGLAVATHQSTTHKTAARSTPTPASTGTGSTSLLQPTATPSPAQTLARGQVQVRVLNGVGIPGAAHAVAKQLEKAGFVVVGYGNAPNAPVRASTIAFPAGATAAERLLSSATGVTAATPTAGDAVLVLTVGRDWSGTLPTPPPQQTYNPPPSPPSNGGGNGNGNGGGNGGGSGGGTTSGGS